jgi:hypothetical protein
MRLGFVFVVLSNGSSSFKGGAAAGMAAHTAKLQRLSACVQKSCLHPHVILYMTFSLSDTHSSGVLLLPLQVCILG